MRQHEIRVFFHNILQDDGASARIVESHLARRTVRPCSGNLAVSRQFFSASLPRKENCPEFLLMCVLHSQSGRRFGNRQKTQKIAIGVVDRHAETAHSLWHCPCKSILQRFVHVRSRRTLSRPLAKDTFAPQHRHQKNLPDPIGLQPCSIGSDAKCHTGDGIQLIGLSAESPDGQRQPAMPLRVFLAQMPAQDSDLRK